MGKPEGVSGMQVDQVADDVITKFRENFRYEDHPGSWQPSVRVKEQDRDGVDAEVLFSSWARTFYSLTDAAFQRSCFRSYNLWLHEFCSYDPKRLIGVPLLSVLDVEKAVQDLNEYAKMGFKGVQLPSGFKEGVYYDPIYEPIWSAAEDSNMLMIIHSGALQGGGSRKWFEKLNSADDWPGFFQHSRQTAVKTVIGQMIFSGSFRPASQFESGVHRVRCGLAWGHRSTGRLPLWAEEGGTRHQRPAQSKVATERVLQTEPMVYIHGRSRRGSHDADLRRRQFPLVERLPSRGLHVALLAANRRSDVRRRERDGEKKTVSRQRQQTLRSGPLERIGGAISNAA